MTSDAKIGLLLGLVFIFVIAFIINGLPNFQRQTDNNELTTNMVSFNDDSLGVADKERKAQEELNWAELLERKSLDPAQFESPLSDNKEIRSVLALPSNVTATKVPGQNKAVDSDSTPLASLTNVKNETVTEKSERAILPSPTMYVVMEGDNLATIAQKFYGPVEGNRRVNIDRIFQANRGRLKSADEIYVGQKLVIPALRIMTSALPEEMFEKVESLGRRHLSVQDASTKRGNWYIVSEGDSLWKIATAKLGNGSRYNEIARLNADILDHEDSLVVGMRLRMPVR